LLGASLDAEAGTSRAAGDVEQELVERFAPILRLADVRRACDPVGDPFDPAPVEIVLGSERIPLRRVAPGRPVVRERPVAFDLFDGEASLFLDFPGNPRFPGCRYERDFRRLMAGRAPAVYARVTREEGRSGVALQYWLFYYFNGAGNPHEGDWELIQLSFAADSPLAALEAAPERIALSQHAGGEVALWSDDKVEKEGDRPIVYVARGSHANYFSPRLYLGRGEAGAGFGCDDTSEEARSVRPRVVLLPDPVSSRLDPFAWLTFRGHWGERQPSFYDSPTGPNRNRAWPKPLSWQEGLRDGSVVVPGGGTMGPQATRAFCTAVDVAAAALNLRATWPYPTAAVGALLLLAIALLLWRTSWWPAAPSPLRAQRDAGQILRAASQLYRRQLRVVLPIAVVFVPVALAAAALQALVFSVAPVEPLLDQLPDDRVVGGAVAFGLDALTSIVAFVVTVAGISSALTALEAGNEVSVFESFRAVLRRGGVLLLANATVVATVLVLVATVVGIPLALRQLVRWSFVTQAVMIDGCSVRRAFHRSAALITGNWWRTLAIALGLGFVALVSGPIVGIVLLLFSPASLTYVDLAASVVYLAAVPYVAVALTLLYYDLDVRRYGQGGERQQIELSHR
jgi:hypothetical protein